MFSQWALPGERPWVGGDGRGDLSEEARGGKMQKSMGSKAQLEPELGELNGSSTSEQEGPRKYVGTCVPEVLHKHFIPSWEKERVVWPGRNKCGLSAPQL